MLYNWFILCQEKFSVQKGSMYWAGTLTEGELWKEGVTRKSRQFDTKAVHTKLPDSSVLHIDTPCSNQGEQLYCLRFVSSSSGMC